MLKADESAYVIDLIAQDNQNTLNQLQQEGVSEARKSELAERIKLSDLVFQALVTSLGVSQGKLSINDKILLVEDTQNMLNIMRAILIDIGFENIDMAKDGVEAWALIQKNQKGYGLVLSDWEMPKMTGLELLKLVRAEKRCKDWPFIIISSTNQLEKVKMAIQAGVTDYLVKPVNQKTLGEKVLTYLSNE